MNVFNTKYTAYLLRLWKTKHNSTRIILQNVHTNEEHLFNNLDDLFTFITDQYGTLDKTNTTE